MCLSTMSHPIFAQNDVWNDDAIVECDECSNSIDASPNEEEDTFLLEPEWFEFLSIMGQPNPHLHAMARTLRRRVWGSTCETYNTCAAHASDLGECLQWWWKHGNSPCLLQMYD